MRVAATACLLELSICFSAAAASAFWMEALSASARPAAWNATRPAGLLGVASSSHRSGAWVSGTWTTGYWDCCKPSCAWPNKGNVNTPILSCDASGHKLADPNLESVCQGGPSASCADNVPFVVSSGLSMGFAAVAVGGPHGLTGDENCGQCYQLVFLSTVHTDGGTWGGAHPELVGKSMVVQVTNIGYDVVGEHSFDIQIPGAGQGIYTDGCARQFPGYSSGDFDCDNNYGGCSERAGCDRLPSQLQAACRWRFDWYRWLVEGGQTNNPYVTFQRVRCPAQLTAISGSVANDDDLYPVVDLSAFA